MLNFLIQIRKKILSIKKRESGVKILRKQFIKKQDAILLSVIFTYLNEYLFFSVEENKESFLREISIQYSFSLLRYFIFYLISR